MTKKLSLVGHIETIFTNGEEDFQRTMVHELSEVLVVILVDEKISHSPVLLNTQVPPGLRKINYNSLNGNVHVCTGMI